MSVKKNDENNTDKKEKKEHRLLISKLRSRIGNKRNRIRSLGDITRLDIDSIPEKQGLESEELFESSRTIERQFDLESQISDIRKRVKRRTSELGRAMRANSVDQKFIAQLKEDLKELQMKERLKYVITRVNEEARQKLFESEKFAALFSERSECDSLVMSMDIRRSTELMLTAVSPQLYAEFITTLTEKLSDCVTDNFGIFEKFTGDGVLAFFPDFYSGDDAFLLAVRTASYCHKTFIDHFSEYSEFFSVDMEQTGLGIGIDTGKISLTTINGDLSIVGTPVVYACRYSAAPAGKTFLTENAYAFAKDMPGSGLQFTPVSVNIKHEGDAPAYEIASEGDFSSAKKPDWDLLTERYS